MGKPTFYATTPFARTKVVHLKHLTRYSFLVEKEEEGEEGGGGGGVNLPWDPTEEKGNGSLFLLPPPSLFFSLDGGGTQLGWREEGVRAVV